MKVISYKHNWLADIPNHWNAYPLWALFEDNKTKNENNIVSNVLSLSYGNIIRRDVESNMGLLPASFETYQIVNDGDIVLRLTDLQNDKKSLRVGLVKEIGIITSAYTGLKLKNPELNSAFYYYFLHALDIMKYFYSLGGGVRQSIGFLELKWLKLPVPPKDEQDQIVNYIKAKSKKIKHFIQKKQAFIELLKEQRQTIISRAVIKGINSDVTLKDSGIEWLGNIPEHWTLRKLKYCVSLNANPIPSDTEGKQYLKIALENIDNWTGKFVETETPDFEGQGNFFKKGDVLFNKLRPYLAKAYVAKEEGFSVGELLVLTPDSKYFTSEYLFQRFMTSDFIEVVNSSTYGAKMPRASWSFIGNLKLPIPPKEEQAKIIAQIKTETAKIDQAIAKAEEEIELIKEYREAMIAEAVLGKQDVKVHTKIVLENAK
ncbi:restriction endonuclease subunit S [Pedobacter sp. UBA4863]|uniref:restriction endonuclease subunit S n=1 Tax=Pedobacter sp. UBA4863 TaxID=1947060 RepID=UPI0025F78DD5|nr:restriction endonuclease subunit S [Pedobacter sp. UBA4863]